MSKYKYADEIPCATCTKGRVLYGKNGYMCEECEDWICESCGDQGWFSKDDDFYCCKCYDALGGKEGIKKTQKKREMEYYKQLLQTKK